MPVILVVSIKPGLLLSNFVIKKLKCNLIEWIANNFTKNNLYNYSMYIKILKNKICSPLLGEFHFIKK
ncbi:MAG: hypothetical protein ACMZHY_02115 [Enterobacterales bacterium]